MIPEDLDRAFQALSRGHSHESPCFLVVVIEGGDRAGEVGNQVGSEVGKGGPPDMKTSLNDLFIRNPAWPPDKCQEGIPGHWRGWLQKVRSHSCRLMLHSCDLVQTAAYPRISLASPPRKP